ncbi:MAG: T9SS type A sorting domain-containing protein [Bacteroidota bacterium]|nr:T9SS type A sorting domain-containing protein [Bacteroidota bacterium]
MKKFISLLLIIFFQSSLNAQLPPNPPLQPGESWTNLWSISYDFQSNGSIRYLVQDPVNTNQWCSVLMAQQDSNTAAGVRRFIYYSYSGNNGFTWASDFFDVSSSWGFPCLTLSNGIPVIACYKSSALGSFVFQDIVFGAFVFKPINGVPIPTATPAIWPHIAGTTNGNLILAASEDQSTVSQPGRRTVYNGSSWSPYSNMPLINGPSGNFDVASGPNGKAAIIGTNHELNNTLSWYRSNDNGNTFDAGSEIINYFIDGGDTLFANLYGGYQAVYDAGGNAHIVFAAYNVNRNAVFSNKYTKAFIKPRIYHWSSQTNVFTAIAGGFNIFPLADTITQHSIEPLCHPTISISLSGKLSCAFTAYLKGNTQVVDNGDTVNAGEIFYAYSFNNGASWSTPLNITNTQYIEEKHPSLPPVIYTDSLRVFYLRDMKAGGWALVEEWGKASVYGILNRMFLIHPPAVPAAPILLSPQNNSTFNLINPLILDWENVSGADSYTIQLSGDVTFSNTIISQTSTTSGFHIPLSVLDYDSIYYWRANARNNFGTSSWSPVWNFRTILKVGINLITEQIPTEFNLFNNYPNPFNPATVIRYSLIENRFTNLTIYDMLGNEVAVLVNEKQSPGHYSVDFNGADLSSGVYFYKIISGEFIQIKKMMLIK